MFRDKGKRFMTRAIAETVPVELQVLLWRLIDIQIEQGEKLDYLQVFELENVAGKQKVVHRQEVPSRKGTIVISLTDAKPMTISVWCIDDGENQTMLFPSDY